MSLLDKSVITSKVHIAHIVNFQNFQIGNTKIVPTDIDGFIEYKGKCYIYIEAKYNGHNLSKAQRDAFTKVCADHKSPTMYMIVKHSYPDEIDLANSIVVEYIMNCMIKGKWLKPRGEYTANGLANEFIKRIFDNKAW